MCTPRLSADRGGGADRGLDHYDSIEGGFGGAFDDSFVGDAGPNRFRGGGGDDHIDGGAGDDTADYGGAGGGVTVDLLLGTGGGADAVPTRC